MGIPFTVRGTRGRRLAGLAIPCTDGRSLRPLFSPAPTPSWRWHARRGLSGSAVDLGRSARDDTPTWQGLVTLTGRKYAQYATGEYELYGLVRDSSESEHAAGEAPAVELERRGSGGAPQALRGHGLPHDGGLAWRPRPRRVFSAKDARGFADLTRMVESRFDPALPGEHIGPP